MSRATAVGVGISWSVGLYAVLIGVAGAPWWGLIILAMIAGAYWSFGRALLFPDEFSDRVAPRSRERRRERRAKR